jgi:hypothetical protein
MAYTIMLHVAGEDAVVGEVDEMPKPTDNSIIVTNPHRKDGKELHYLDQRAVKVIWPMHRLNFIEILGGEEEDQIIGFVRE